MAASRVVTTTACGHVDLPDPRRRVEAGQREAGLHGPAAVGERELAGQPAPQAGSSRARRLAGVGGRSQRVQQRRSHVAHRLQAAEAVGRGAQHEARHTVAVAVPREQRDRAAHRVADDDGALDAEHVEGGDGVVGAAGQAERARRADAPAVAAVVDGDDAVALGQRRVAGNQFASAVAPSRGAGARVGAPAGPPAGARTSCPGPAARAARRAAATGVLGASWPGGRPRPTLPGPERRGHWMATTSTVSVAPVGEVKSTLSPTSSPRSA